MDMEWPNEEKEVVYKRSIEKMLSLNEGLSIFRQIFFWINSSR